MIRSRIERTWCNIITGVMGVRATPYRVLFARITYLPSYFGDSAGRTDARRFPFTGQNRLRRNIVLITNSIAPVHIQFCHPAFFIGSSYITRRSRRSHRHLENNKHFRMRTHFCRQLTEAVSAAVAIGKAYTRAVRCSDLKPIYLVNCGVSAPKEALRYKKSDIDSQAARSDLPRWRRSS